MSNTSIDTLCSFPACVIFINREWSIMIAKCHAWTISTKIKTQQSIYYTVICHYYCDSCFWWSIMNCFKKCFNNILSHLISQAIGWPVMSYEHLNYHAILKMDFAQKLHMLITIHASICVYSFNYVHVHVPLPNSSGTIQVINMNL